jgi:hypothetical protein
MLPIHLTLILDPKRVAKIRLTARLARTNRGLKTLTRVQSSSVSVRENSRRLEHLMVQRQEPAVLGS